MSAAEARACAYCGRALGPGDPAKYCNRECMAAAYRTSVAVECEVCGRTFYAKPAVIAMGGGRFCSYACMGQSYRRPVEVTCARCGKTWTDRESKVGRGRVEYCSNECKYAHWRENPSLNPNWKGGVTAERRNPRLQWRYRHWRKAVLERDGHRCQVCGATENLHAHHVKPWGDYRSLRFDVDNGQTLCRSCHHNAHRKASKVTA